MLYENTESLIGKGPLVRLNKITKSFQLNASIYAKLENNNLTGSVKDRAAMFMINDAEKKGLLKKGSTIIEPTSGNTGIALAALAAIRGYEIILTMPDTMTIERQKLLKVYGAKLVLTDGKLGMKGAIAKANELNDQIDGSIILGQFDNNSNSKAHYETTAPEIWDDLNGKIDIVIAGIGTGGTISGIGEYLKSKKSDIQIIGVEPSSSPFLSKGVTGKHKIQGIGAGFKPNILNTSVIDQIICAEDEHALEMQKKLAQTEGLFMGVSAAAALCVAVEVANKGENANKNIVVIMPDTGMRYLSNI